MIRHSPDQMYFLCSQSPASSFRHINIKIQLKPHNLSPLLDWSIFGTGLGLLNTGGIITLACSAAQLSKECSLDRVQHSPEHCSLEGCSTSEMYSVAH
jgi:hypothetical protein